MEPSKSSFIKRAESKQTLSTFSYSKSFATIYPNFSYKAVIEMIDKEPIARGALTHFVDKCMEGDFIIVKRDSWKPDMTFQDKLQKDYNFRTSILRKVFLMGKMNNNVFIEIVRNGDGSPKEFNVLETSTLNVRTKANGDLEILESTIKNKDGSTPTWSAEDIVWIKFNDRSEGYAPMDLKAVWETVLLKDYIRQYIAWLWKTGQYRLIYKFKNASDQDIQDFITISKRNDNNFQIPQIIKGELETGLLRDPKEMDFVDKIFKYLDNQILIAMRIPPNDAGIPDASGRSNADAQANNLGTHITSMKTIVADSINNDLFLKINRGNNMLRFSPADRFAEKQVWETVQIMASVGVKKSVIQEYLVDKGIIFDEEEYFEPLPVTDVANPRNKDMAPSRQGKGTGEGNQPQAEVTTRPDQLKKQ